MVRPEGPPRRCHVGRTAPSTRRWKRREGIQIGDDFWPGAGAAERGDCRQRDFYGPQIESGAGSGKLVDRRLTGIVMNHQTDARGELVFEQACKMGLEGIVSKRLSKPYQSGRSGHWLKIKNPGSPAMVRARDHFAQLGP